MILPFEKTDLRNDFLQRDMKEDNLDEFSQKILLKILVCELQLLK